MEKKRVLLKSFILLVSLAFVISFVMPFVFADPPVPATLPDGQPNPTAFNVANSNNVGDKFYEGFATFVDETPVVNVLFGIFFGLWDPDAVISGIYDAGTSKMGSLVIFFVAWILTFIILKNVLDLAIPLNTGTNILISLGLTIAATQLKWVFFLASWGASGAALLGVVSSWLLIIASLVLFILAIFGNTLLHKWIIHLRMLREAGKVQEGAAQTEQAIRALKGVQKEFAK